MCETDPQWEVSAQQQGALRQPGGAGQCGGAGGRRFNREGRMYTYLLVHMVAWQKPIQHSTAIILQLEKNKAEDEIQRFSTISETASSTKVHFSMSVSPQAWRTAASFPVGQNRTVVVAPPRVLYCLWPADNVSQRISLIGEVRNAATKENSQRRLNNNNAIIKDNQGPLVLSQRL